MSTVANREAERSLHAEREERPDEFQQLIGRYREAVRRYLDSASLRQAAREIGLSPTGLQKFCDGAQPYIPTIRKLREWYAVHRQGE
jgi:hypothetical protein